MGLIELPYLLFQLFANQDFLELNLPFALGFRVLFNFIYLIFYKIYGDREQGLFTTKESKRGFLIKELILIILGTFHLMCTVIIGIYSCLSIGIFFKKMNTLSNHAISKILLYFFSFLFLIALPVGFLVFMYFESVYIEMVLGILTIDIFAMHSLNIADKSKEIVRKIAERYDLKTTTKKMKTLILSAICITPLLAFSGEYGVIVEQYMVTMRDGVRLATRVYRPRYMDSPLPVILMRTPYNQDGLTSSARRWLAQGFIVVTQDFRGQYYSEYEFGGGEFRAFMSCAADGYDTCQWIVSQSWCNGKIGTMGMSAGAINQYTFAAEQAPGLVCQHLDMGDPELYDHLFFQGGKWKGMGGEWINACRMASLNFWNKPFVGIDAMAQEFIQHPIKDDYWANGSLEMNNRYENVAVRALHFGGWQDCFQEGTLKGFMGYNQNGTDYAKDHQKLIIGPYTHGSRTGPCGGLIFPNAKYGTEVAEKWRNQIFWESLQPNNALYSPIGLWDEPNVLYYVMGDVLNSSHTANQWRYANNWPIVNTFTSYYLLPNGQISTISSGMVKNFSFIFDPENPIPTLGGANLLANEYAGFWDQRLILNARSDLINFTSETLSQPLEIIGNVKVKLWISSNCTDTDFTAKLCDVYPSGEIINVVDGIISVRKRNGLDKDELIIPNETYPIEIDLWSTAYQFNAGHKLQLFISSSNAPKFQVCPNTGDPIALHYSTTYDANNTILVGGIYDSQIYLPINPL